MTSRVVSFVMGAVITLCLTVFVWWWVWPEAPRWIRRTFLSEYSYLFSLVLIIVGLSFLDYLIGKFVKKSDH